MGLSEPCSCISVPYQGTMKKICPSPPLRGSYGRDVFSLPSLKLEKFAASARYRGQWSDPREFLKQGFKQVEYDDRALFQRRLVRIGHTVLRRPTSPTPFTTIHTEPATAVSTPPSVDNYYKKNWESDDNKATGTLLTQSRFNPQPFIPFPQQRKTQDLSSVLNDEAAENQYQYDSGHSSPGRSQVQPNTYIQNSPLIPTSQQHSSAELSPPPGHYPSVSGESKPPITNQDGQLPILNGLDGTQNENILALEELQKLSQNFQNQEKINISLLLPNDIIPDVFNQIHQQKLHRDSESKPSIQSPKIQQNTVQVSNPFLVAPIPIYDTPTYAEENRSSVLIQNVTTELLNNTQVFTGDTSEPQQEPNTNTRQNYTAHAQVPLPQVIQEPEKSAAQEPALRGAKKYQMPEVVHTSNGRLVRVDPRFMDISALMKVFNHNNFNKMVQKNILVNSANQNKDSKQSSNMVGVRHDIGSIGDTQRK